MKRILLMVLLLAGVISVRAQEEESFSDEDLTKYATVMVWAEVEQTNLGKIVSDSVAVWIEGTALETSRYNELRTADKKGSLEDVDATEDELTVFAEVTQKIEDKKTKFKEAYVGKIKSDIGSGLYNKLKKALKTDDEVKARYEAIYSKLLDASKEEEQSEDAED